MLLEDVLLFLAFVLGWIALLWSLVHFGKIPRPSDSAEPAGEEKFGFALMGPFLMWKTGRGRRFLDRLAQRPRFWRWFGDLSLVLVGIAMVSMTALLLWLAVLVVSIPPGREPTPQMLLGIPGLNPLIPVWYGILALGIAIIVHEFCHGILARVSKIRLNSLGLLFFIVPVGAFVEPDEGEMKRMPRRERARLFAAGPAVNLLFALATAFIFSTVLMGSVVPVAHGVGISAVTPSSPAETAGLRAGMILLAVNNTNTTDIVAFIDAMAVTQANQTVVVNYTAKGMAAPVSLSVVLGDAANFTGDESRRGKGFLGVQAFPARLTTAYFHPIGGADEFGGLLPSTIAYISLPFTGLQPMQGLATQFFEVQGPLASLGDGFWILANIMYWLFWLNLMLGMTNALPAVPLDGGYIFRDAITALVERLRGGMAVEARERVVKNVSYAFAFLILGLILWQFIGPRIF
ncbi:MAG TPA: site-2 protease family protein [Thermoplasmata archaeon]|jgi:membrane-associated protease RseP (regulator of RpoE activity)|nr:site-2 protease family protein [Thermoplasmata archaeon]